MSLGQLLAPVAQVLFSNITNAIVNFLILSALTHLFSEHVVGEVLLAYSMVVVWSGALEFGFPNALMVLSRGQQSESKKVFSQLLTVVVMLLVFAAPVQYLASVYAIHFDKSASILVLVSTVSHLLFRLTLSVFQVQGRWQRYSISNVALNVTRLAVLIIVGKLLGLSSSLLAVLAAVCCAILLTTASNVSAISSGFFRLDKPSPTTLSRVLPLGLANIVSLVILRGQPFVFALFFDRDQLAIYSVASTLAVLVSILTASVAPVYLRFLAQNSRFPVDVYRQYLIVVILIAVGIIAFFPFSGFLIERAFGQRYAASAAVFMSLAAIHLVGLLTGPLELNVVRHRADLVLLLKVIELVTYFSTILLLARVLGYWAMVAGMLAMRFASAACVVAFNRWLPTIERLA